MPLNSSVVSSPQRLSSPLPKLVNERLKPYIQPMSEKTVGTNPLKDALK